MRRMWIAMSLLLPACTTTTTPTDREFAGYFASGFEVESFRACGTQAEWWVTEATELRTRYRTVSQKPYDEVFVVVRGEVGPEGEYGHLGAYERELLVTEVVEVRAGRQAGCD